MTVTAIHSPTPGRGGAIGAAILFQLALLGNCGCAPSVATQTVTNACKDSDIMVLQRIVNSGAVRNRIQKGDIPIEDEWMYPIHAAAWFGNSQALKMFLAAGVDANQRDSDNKTPVMYLLEGESINDETLIECIDTLIRSHADLSGTDKYGHAAMHFAADYSSSGIIEHLLNSGAEVDPADKRGNTPLHRACENSLHSRKDCVIVLLRAGADRSRKNEAGKTPQDICETNPRCDCRQLLSPKTK